MSKKVYCFECKHFRVEEGAYTTYEACAKAPEPDFIEESYKVRPKTIRGHLRLRPRDLNAKNNCKEWEPLE